MLHFIAYGADGFLSDAKNGAYIQGWGWDDDVHDHRAHGGESWTIDRAAPESPLL